MSPQGQGAHTGPRVQGESPGLPSPVSPPPRSPLSLSPRGSSQEEPYWPRPLRPRPRQPWKASQKRASVWKERAREGGVVPKLRAVEGKGRLPGRRQWEEDCWKGGPPWLVPCPPDRAASVHPLPW